MPRYCFAHRKTTWLSCNRWNRRDILDENYSANIYTYCKDDSITKYDKLGLLLPNFDREKNITIIDLREYNLKMSIYRGGRTMGVTTMFWPEFETFAACYGNMLGLILTYPPEIEVIYYSNHIDRLGNTLEEHEAYHVNSNISYWNWFARTANYYEKEYDLCDDCLRYLNELKNVYIAYKKAAKKVQDDFDLKTSHSLLPE